MLQRSQPQTHTVPSRHSHSHTTIHNRGQHATSTAQRLLWNSGAAYARVACGHSTGPHIPSDTLLHTRRSSRPQATATQDRSVTCQHSIVRRQCAHAPAGLAQTRPRTQQTACSAGSRLTVSSQRHTPSDMQPASRPAAVASWLEHLSSPNSRLHALHTSQHTQVRQRVRWAAALASGLP